MFYFVRSILCLKMKKTEENCLMLLETTMSKLMPWFFHQAAFSKSLKFWFIDLEIHFSICHIWYWEFDAN